MRQAAKDAELYLRRTQELEARNAKLLAVAKAAADHLSHPVECAAIRAQARAALAEEGR